MAHYDEYLSKFDSDSEDENDPVIKQLKHNALFSEENGFINCLPGYKKPPLIIIEPVPEPPKKPAWMLDNGLGPHDKLVNSMTEMALKMKDMSLSASKDYHSSETLPAHSPKNRPRKQQRSRVASEASTSSKQSEPEQQETVEKQHINGNNQGNRKTGGKRKGNRTKNTTKTKPCHQKAMNDANVEEGVN